MKQLQLSLLKGLFFVLIIAIPALKADEANTSILVTNYNDQLILQDEIKHIPVKGKIFEIGHIVYSQYLADRFGLINDNVAALDRGLHTIEFKMKTEGGATRCYLNMLLDNTLGLDKPKESYVMRESRRGMRIRFPAKLKRLNQNRQGIKRKEAYFNKNAYLVGSATKHPKKENFQNTLLFEFSNTYFKYLDYFSLEIDCGANSQKLLKSKTASVWLKQKKGKKAAHSKPLDGSDFIKFKIPLELKQKILPVMQQNGSYNYLNILKASEAKSYPLVKNPQSQLVTNYLKSWFPHDRMIEIPVKSRMFDLGHVIYSPEFAGKYNFPKSHVSRELNQGLHVLEFRMKIEGGFTRCYWNTLFDKHLNIDTPSRPQVLRYSRHKMRLKFPQKRAGLKHYYETKEDQEYRIKVARASENRLNGTYRIATQNYEWNKRGSSTSNILMEYADGYFGEYKYISMSVGCTWITPDILEKKNTRLHAKQPCSILPECRKTREYRYIDSMKFTIPNRFTEKVLPLMRLDDKKVLFDYVDNYLKFNQ